MESKKEKSLRRWEKEIMLVALIITIIFSYDEKIKCSNNKVSS